FVSEKFYGSGSAMETGAKSVTGGWSEYSDSSKPFIEKDRLNYIYARITTNAGTDDKPDYVYISSKGIWEDETKPVVSAVTPTADATSASVKVTGSDDESGIASYHLLVKKSGEAAPSANEIIKNGIKDEKGEFAVKDLIKATTYDFYAVIVDKAGNISEIKKASATTKADPPTGVIKVDKFTYKTLQGSDVVESTYYKEPQKITITAKGDVAVSKLQYYITNKFFSSTKALENEVAPKSTKTSDTTETKGTETTTTVDKWSDYNPDSKPSLKKNMVNYIYAKITDASGNIVYLSSKGIWEDETAPKVNSVKATPADTTAEVKVNGQDGESGIRYYYLMAKKADESSPDKPKDVKSDGTRGEDGKFKLDGLTANTKYSLYAVIEDKAGNISEIKKTGFTTKKGSGASNAAKSGAGGAGSGAGAGSGSGGSGSNVNKRTAGAEGEGSGGDDKEDEGIRDGVPYIEDASEGILIGREKTSGWDRIEGEVGKASAPAQVYVNMNGGTEVPAAALKQCEKRDVTYYFVMNDDIIWAVNGLSFTEAPRDIDFRVRTDTKNIPSKLVNEIADVYPHTNLTLEHDGDFGFTAILSINVGKNNEGMYANLYYYNEDKNSLEFQESAEVDGSGRASFDFLHASDYTVILRGDALTDKTAAALMDGSLTSTGGGSGGGYSSPRNVSKNTGHLWLIIVSIISFLLCGIILFMPDKKRRRRSYAGT
ncbi:MAG: Ig-like domain repeat protein, partial [Lachnospiraceae bacterium]|nr:Ig-like domain repeat protein [Lachnospiraceae bacterium]